jgi:hypothetical protein
LLKERNSEKQGKLNERKNRLCDAFLDGKVPEEECRTQLNRIGTLLSEQKVEDDTPSDYVQVSELIDFSSWFLNHAASIWFGADSTVKTRIQTAVFPTGILVTKAGVRTPEPICIFKQLQSLELHGIELASPGGFEPPFSP